MLSIRRNILKSLLAAAATRQLLPFSQAAQSAPPPTTANETSIAPARTFDPQPSQWRTFEVTTRVEIAPQRSVTKVWLPVPSIESPWQTSVLNSFQSSGNSTLTTDGAQGVKLLLTELPVSTHNQIIELSSIVKTKDRNDLTASAHNNFRADSADNLKYYTRSTVLLPTNGIVQKTALQITSNARSDAQKVKAIYDWVVANAWREPKVRGCGEGDIKLMLETGYLGGKCADINALFVGLCRAVQIPARDLYGVRLAPSNFGYKELSGNPDNLKGSQHCRAEVYLNHRGWVAMDPADVAKVMRQETPEWIKSTSNPVVKPVYQTLFGAWEGNWLAWNSAHDLKLPLSVGENIGFLMYPVAENAQGRFDSYSPDSFKYQITAKEMRTEKVG